MKSKNFNVPEQYIEGAAMSNVCELPQPPLDSATPAKTSRYLFAHHCPFFHLQTLTERFLTDSFDSPSNAIQRHTSWTAFHKYDCLQ